MMSANLVAKVRAIVDPDAITVDPEMVWVGIGKEVQGDVISIPPDESFRYQQSGRIGNDHVQSVIRDK